MSTQVFLPGIATDATQTIGARPKSREFLKVLGTLAVAISATLSAAAVGFAKAPHLFTPDTALWPTIDSFAPFVAVSAAILPFGQVLEGILLGSGDLTYLSKSQFLNVVVSLATFSIAKAANVGIKGTWVTLIAFYASRLAQAAFRCLVSRRPWRNWRAFTLAPAAEPPKTTADWRRRCDECGVVSFHDFGIRLGTPRLDYPVDGPL